jgi:hypothetical protein
VAGLPNGDPSGPKALSPSCGPMMEELDHQWAVKAAKTIENWKLKNGYW